MEFVESRLKGVYFVKLKPFEDERGFFMRTYDDNLFEQMNIHKVWRQENHSRSNQKGILRGLHFQLPPYSETKLVRCIHGEVLDVFVDLRDGSPTFGQYDSVLLSAENKTQVLIPRGFAHGFLTLSDVSEVVYKVDNYYNKDNERGLIWNDKDLGINWPISNPMLSEKDKLNLTFQEFKSTLNSIKV
jgi:dTDP-4-dehydrorhamnose 3,5-epimerase